MKRYEWLNDDSRLFLSRGYLKEGTQAEDRIAKIVDTAGKYLSKIPDFKEKFEEYLALGYYSMASPVWANFGETRGLPISCNGQFIDDTMESILYCNSETGMMTKYGAGTSAYFGALRGRGAPISDGGESFGACHFMQLFDTTTKVVCQSSVRRGAFAAYYPVEGPDILDFLEIRELGNPIHKMSIGVTITDKWMNEMFGGDVDKKMIWLRILRKKFETGYPYIFWTDTVNNNAPIWFRDKGLKIHASNLCSEICLPSDNENSFVCDLSSMNLLYYDEWKNTDAVEILTYFLDAVMEEYIQKTENIPFMDKANRFAKDHRALGVGGLGWHSYLQANSIPFESMSAKLKNVEIWKFINQRTIAGSEKLAQLYGEPKVTKGYGRRNSTLVAIAPTVSSSFILGQVSQGIEPIESNYFEKDLAKGDFPYKNPHLKEVLKTYNKDNKDTWGSILEYGGSVQHLDFLSDHEKEVFKTFMEISQKEVIIQAAARQKFIDQSQSLNLSIHPDTPVVELSRLLKFAWESGVKTLYYHNGLNPSQELARDLMADQHASRDINKCVSCEA
jgi:ribonucleoside-diphosphate reductase alpha chain